MQYIKSTTILNYCGIDNSHIDFICDTNKDKIVNLLPNHIPIFNIDYFRNNIPDYTFYLLGTIKEIFKEKILNKTNWFAHINIEND